jgi:hypothetical protein
MKVKTSVALSVELLEAIAAQDRSRSEFLEAAAWAYLATEEREARYRREVELLNQLSDELNTEQTDVLLDQADI